MSKDLEEICCTYEEKRAFQAGGKTMCTKAHKIFGEITSICRYLESGGQCECQKMRLEIDV